MVPQVFVIDLSGDASHAETVPVSREHAAFGVLEEGVLLAQPTLDVDVQGPDVVGVVAVDVIDHLKEGVDLAVQGYLAEFHGHFAGGS
jgi:hypothetical protein